MATELPMAKTIAKVSALMIWRKPGSWCAGGFIFLPEHSVIEGCASTTTLLC